MPIRIGQDPVPIPGCEHCPTGVPCDPATGACAKGMCLLHKSNSILLYI